MKSRYSPEEVRLLLKEKLEKIDFIEFAVLFGSYAKGNVNALSDVDIGVFTSKALSLLEIGGLITGLQSVLKINVDLVILNSLYQRKPSFAYEIISKGDVLFCKNRSTFTDYKRNVFIYFLDNKFLVDRVNKMFFKRLNNGEFGGLGHVRTNETPRKQH